MINFHRSYMLYITSCTLFLCLSSSHFTYSSFQFSFITPVNNCSYILLYNNSCRYFSQLLQALILQVNIYEYSLMSRYIKYVHLKQEDLLWVTMLHEFLPPGFIAVVGINCANLLKCPINTVNKNSSLELLFYA